MPRQKAAPKRDAQALVQVSGARQHEEEEEEELSEDEWVPPPSTAGPTKKPKTSEDTTTTTAVPSSSHPEEVVVPAPEKKKPAATATKAKPTPTSTEYGDSVDASYDLEALAADYVTAGAESGGASSTKQLGASMHRQLLCTARLDAADRGGNAVSLQEGKREDDGKRPLLTVTYTFNKKTFEDIIPLYTPSEVTAVFARVLEKQSTKRRKANASHVSVKIEEVAKRSPPLFWSLFYHCHADVVKGLARVLAEAVASIEGNDDGDE